MTYIYLHYKAWDLEDGGALSFLTEMHSVVKILGLALFTNFKCKKRIEGDVIWEKTAISSCIHTSSTHGRWRFAAKAAIKE